MESNVVVPVYKLAKNFVDICERDEEMKKYLFELDTVTDIDDLDDVDDSDIDLKESIVYLMEMQKSYCELEKYFFNIIIENLERSVTQRNDDFKVLETLFNLK